MTKFLLGLASVARDALGLGLLVVATSGTAFAGFPPSVPEIDAGSLVGAVTLLAGGFLILGNRRRRPTREASSSS